MAVLNAYQMLTAIEQVKRSGNDDQRRIIEELSKTNEIMLDAPMDEANDRVVNTGLVRTYIPTGNTHRAYNEGVGNVATQTKTVHDYMCEIAAFSDVDCSEADAAANRDQYRMDEAAGIIQGLGEDQAYDLLYGDHDKDPHYCTGLITRRPKIDNKYCVDMGGTGNALTSIVLVKWSRQHTKLIYPKGASGCGVRREDRGKQKVSDGNGKFFMAYEEYFQANYGLACKTEKSIIRLANIGEATTGDDIIKAVIKAVPNFIKGDGNIVAYANADSFSKIDLSIADKSNVMFNPSAPYGENPPLRFRNVTFRQVDALLNTESQVK